MSENIVKKIFNTPDFPVQTYIGGYGSGLKVQTPIAEALYFEAGVEWGLVGAIPLSRKLQPSFWDIELKLSRGSILGSTIDLPFGYNMDGLLNRSATLGAALMTGPDFHRGKWGFNVEAGAKLVFVNLAENEDFSTENIPLIPVPTLEGSLGLSYRVAKPISLGLEYSQGYMGLTSDGAEEPCMKINRSTVGFNLQWVPQKKS